MRRREAEGKRGGWGADLKAPSWSAAKPIALKRELREWGVEAHGVGCGGSEGAQAGACVGQGEGRGGRRAALPHQAPRRRNAAEGRRETPTPHMVTRIVCCRCVRGRENVRVGASGAQASVLASA